MYFPKKTPASQNEPLLQSSSEHGRALEYDPTFKGMRKEGRACRDVVFAILFIMMVAAMGVISFISFSQGNPSLLVPSNQFTSIGEDKGKYWFQDAVAHMKTDYDVMLGALAFALILAVVWIQLMRVFTKLFIYLTLVVGILLMIAAGVYTYTLGAHQLSSSLKITSYAIFGMAFLMIVAVVFFYKKINLTAAVFAETCKGVSYNPGIFVVALIITAFFIVFVCFWVTSFVYLYSIPADSVSLPNTPPKFKESVRNLMVFQFFGFLWVTAFISGVLQVSVAGAMSTWYFSRDIRGYQGPASPSFTAFGYALTKNFGSIAFGSLVLAVVEFINWALRITKKTNQTNKVVVALICIAQCFFGCLQRLVKFINRFAYVYIAMHGDSFCTSARECFDLIGRNAVSALVLDFLGKFVLFVGKILGTAATTTFVVFLLNVMGRHISGVTLLIVAGSAFFIFHFFSHILGVGVDAVFVCYLEDMERNKGGNLYMDPELHRLLQDKALELKQKEEH